MAPDLIIANSCSCGRSRLQRRPSQFRRPGPLRATPTMSIACSMRAREFNGGLMVPSRKMDMLVNDTRTRELYSSPNGDRGQLCKDASGRVFVLHQANVPSGVKSGT
jgi:hypothetical protein